MVEATFEEHREIDGDEWQCVLDHACHLLGNLPTTWGPSSLHIDAEVIQKAFFLLLKRGLARCRMEGRVTPTGSLPITIHMEIWDGFSAEAMQAAFRDAAGVNESAAVNQVIRQWSVTTLGLAKRGASHAG